MSTCSFQSQSLDWLPHTMAASTLVLPPESSPSLLRPLFEPTCLGLHHLAHSLRSTESLLKSGRLGYNNSLAVFWSLFSVLTDWSVQCSLWRHVLGWSRNNWKIALLFSVVHREDILFLAEVGTTQRLVCCSVLLTWRHVLGWSQNKVKDWSVVQCCPPWRHFVFGWSQNNWKIGLLFSVVHPEDVSLESQRRMVVRPLSEVCAVSSTFDRIHQRLEKTFPCPLSCIHLPVFISPWRLFNRHKPYCLVKRSPHCIVYSKTDIMWLALAKGALG